MMPLYKLKRQFSTKEENLLEKWLQIFKLAYFGAITLGVIWSLLYFGFVANALPDFDASTLLAYLIAISGIGLFLIIIITLVFIIPGIFYWLFQNKKNKEETISRVNPVLYVYILATLIFTYIICEQIKLLGNFIIAFAAVIIAYIALAFEKLAESLSRKSACLTLINFFLFLSIPAMFSFAAASSIQHDPAVIVSFFAVLVLTAAFVNAKIAEEGIGFSKTSTKRSVLDTIIGFLSVALFFLLLLSSISMFKGQYNFLLTAPFRILKVGLYKANLTLDKDFIKLTKIDSLRGKSTTSDQSKTKLCFEVLSSIGTEYIVVPLPDEKCKTQDYRKSRLEKNEVKDADLDKMKHILRIPKNKILLIEYLKPESEDNSQETSKSIISTKTGILNKKKLDSASSAE